MNNFSIREAFSKGWHIFTKNKGLLVLLALIYMVLGGAGKGNSWHAGRGYEFHSPGIIQILLYILSLLVQIGVVKALLKLLDGERTDWKEIFRHGDLFIKYLCVSLLYILGIGVGFVLLIIPGIWFMLTYTFAPVLIVDKKLAIGAAFAESKRLTMGHKWKLLVLFLAMIGVNILGAICLIVGLLVSVPISGLAYLYVYRKLSRE